MSTQLIDFESGSLTTGDSGERTDSDATKPIAAGEGVKSAVFDRPLENLRARTEELRKKVEELLYRADADKWIITGGDAMGQVTLSGAVPFPEVTWSASAGAFLITEDIVVQPFMAPKTDLFASQDYVFGGAATFTFSLTAHTATPAIGPLRQDYQLANSARIIWEEALPGAISGGYCEAALEGSPEHILRITIRNDGLTQASNVVTALNLILAPTVTTSPFSYVLAGIGSTYVLLSDITGSTDVTLTSSYSRELHLIARTDVPTFFGSNPLADDGDGVGIWFEELVDSVATERGGRRQATPLTYDDVLHSQPNTTVPVSKLFLFSATPEQIPGAIPLCRRIGTSLVFIDGTVVADGQTVQFGQSENYMADILALLADQAGIDAGNTLIGCDAITDTPTSASAGTLREQLVELMTAINARARHSSAETIDAAWNFNYVSAPNKYDVNHSKFMGGPWAQAMLGGMNNPQLTSPNQIVYDADNALGSLVDVDNQYTAVGSTGVNSVVACGYLNASSIFMRYVCVLHANRGTSGTGIGSTLSYIDPQSKATNTVQLAGLPLTSAFGYTGAWSAIDACSNGRYLFVVFDDASGGPPNDGNYCVQCYDAQSSFAPVWAAAVDTVGACYSVYASSGGQGHRIVANSAYVAVARVWDLTAGQTAILVINAADGSLPVLNNGNGVLTPSVGDNISCICLHGNYVYYAIEPTTGNWKIANVLLSDPTTGVGLTITTSYDKTISSMVSDGYYIWYTMSTSSTSSDGCKLIACIPLTGTTVKEWSNNATPSLIYAFGGLVCDGVNLWMQCLSSAGGQPNIVKIPIATSPISKVNISDFDIYNLYSNAETVAVGLMGVSTYDGDTVWVAPYLGSTAGDLKGDLRAIRFAARR